MKRRDNTRFQTNSTSSSSIWRPNLKREGVVQPKPYTKAKSPKAKRILIRIGKVSLNLNLLVIEILNVLSIYERGILHLSVQTKMLYLQETMWRLNLKVTNLKVKRCHF